jgi:hypothetical protein
MRCVAPGLSLMFAFSRRDGFRAVRQGTMPLEKKWARERSVLSAEQTEKLFRAANPEVIPFLTPSFFAGNRRATLERLDWSDVRFNETMESGLLRLCSEAKNKSAMA